jgi:DNA-binding CsgD family transcriptional regulator
MTIEQLITAVSHPLPLTKREAEVFYLLLQDLSIGAIASKLFISPHTVNSHIKPIYQALNVKSRLALILWAHKNGHL